MPSGTPVKTTVRRRRDPRLRETLHETVLPCGLRATVLPRKGFRSSTALFATRYGSVDLAFRTAEEERWRETPPGIAHFLEHQLFKKQGGQDILMEFGRFGASSNAFTEYTATTYYFSTSGDFDGSLDLLVRLTFSPFFDPEHVAKEKLIIEQELRMYEDMPDYRGYRELVAALYREHPVRIDVGGTVESIQQIDAALLERCYRVFYHPANMVFLAVGDLDPEKVFRRLERALPPGRFPTDRVAGRRKTVEPAGVGRDRVETRMTVSRPRVLVGMKDLSGDGMLERDVTTTAVLNLLFGRSGRFYTRAYESGLIDDSFSYSYTGEEEFGFSLVGGETDDPDRLAREVRGEMERALKGRFPRRDVERIRRKMIGKYLRAFDSPEGSAFLVLGCLLRGIDPFEIPSTIQRITPRGLDRRLREHYRPENLAVSLVRPKPA